MNDRDPKRRWEKDVFEPLLNKHPERKENFSTPSGIPIPPFLVPEDLGLDYESDLGFPGEFPFTRGVQPNMHRGRLWKMRQ